MSLNSLCFIYRFIDDSTQAGYRIIGAHDQVRPWTPQQLAANGLITQKFTTRAGMEATVESLAKKFQVSSYSLLSINEYNSLMEESHQLDDFRQKLQSREISLLGQKLAEKEEGLPTPNALASEKQQNHGFFSRLFGSDT